MKTNSLALINPLLAAQWHPTLNGDLLPTEVTVGSANSAWWQCKHGHVWKAAVFSRIQGRGCPYCAGKLPILGETDLATLNPDLAKQWHPIKNEDLSPTQVTAGSNRKAWWQCEHGHEWEAEISSRTKGRGCPYCAGQLPILGETDLATLNPDLAKQWHPTKNGDLSPTQVTVSSNREVWWQCEYGHAWKARVEKRNNASGCPYCAGRLPIPGITDLATINPELAKQWHPTLNDDLLPTHVSAGTYTKVWWRCEHGHQWKASIASRMKEYGCPFCAGLLPIVGETDFATLKPDLAKQWHPTLNGDLLPFHVTVKSGKKVWWQCEHGHEWQSSVSNRSGGRSCPYCAGQLPILGETDLATVNPTLADQWHPTKNEALLPSQVCAHSGRAVWWRCEEGHQWLAKISNRSSGSDCPYCMGCLPVVGETDLLTTNPILASQWHPTKNGDFTPSQVTAGSGKKVWWKCEHGHEWEAMIASRTKGRGCPYCAGRLPIEGETDLLTTNPKLAAQWHPTNNDDLLPTQVTANSNKKVWWKCEQGHEWQASITNRFKGCGCIGCRKQKIKKSKYI